VENSQKLKIDSTPERDVVAVACYRSRRGAQIAVRIEGAIVTGAASAQRVVDCLRECARPENAFHAEDMHNDAGELFKGLGTLWTCNERLCPACLSDRSRRARGRVRAALGRVAPIGDERWRFVTLTMPTMAARDVPLLAALYVVARAWRLFSKRDWWSGLVRAGVKGVEFTLGNPKRLEREGREWSPEVDGYHVHIHLLVLSGWVEWSKLREEWSECLRASWSEQGIEQSINTKDGLAVCDVRLIVNRKQGAGRGITSEGAVNEVAKYVTKCESWLSVPESQLVEVASIERWPRMFELLGECRERRTPAQIEAAKAKREDRKLDNQWRDEVARRRAAISVDERLEALQTGGEVKTKKHWLVEEGKLVEQEVEVINDFELYQQAIAERAVVGELEPETLHALEARTAYLDTQNLSAAENCRDGTITQGKARGLSLRKVGLAMIGRGEREKWREMLAACAADVRSFRRAQQCWRYPYANFSSLAGGRWYGLRANPASCFSG
jgi:hypothetical protein